MIITAAVHLRYEESETLVGVPVDRDQECLIAVRNRQGRVTDVSTVLNC